MQVPSARNQSFADATKLGSAGFWRARPLAPRPSCGPLVDDGSQTFGEMPVAIDADFKARLLMTVVDEVPTQTGGQCAVGRQRHGWSLRRPAWRSTTPSRS